MSGWQPLSLKFCLALNSVHLEHQYVESISITSLHGLPVFLHSGQCQGNSTSPLITFLSRHKYAHNYSRLQSWQEEWIHAPVQQVLMNRAVLLACLGLAVVSVVPSDHVAEFLAFGIATLFWILPTSNKEITDFNRSHTHTHQPHPSPHPENLLGRHEWFGNMDLSRKDSLVSLLSIFG